MTDNVIGRKIRMAFVWKNLPLLPETIQWFAEKIDLTYAETNDYISGVETPDSTTLIAISKALGVSIDWLTTDLKTEDALMRDGLKYRRLVHGAGSPPKEKQRLQKEKVELEQVKEDACLQYATPERVTGPKDSLQIEIKEWQVLTGRFASLANHLANIIIEAGRDGKVSDNDLYEANEAIDKVSNYLVFDERE